MRWTACLSSLPALLAAACNAAGPPASSFGTLSLTTAPADASSSGTGGSSTTSVPEDSTTAASPASSTGGETSGGTTLALDVGTPDAGVPPGPAGCRGKIDFLFVISRTYHMHLLQDKLIAAFPKFIETIETQFADFDYQIMVVDGDAAWGSYYCNESCDHPWCDIPDYPCEAMLTGCDTTFGAGIVFNAGELTPNAPCPIAGDRRYLVKGQPDLPDTFECLARVGIDGRGEIGEALARAVTPVKTGQCNEGFVRDEALLVVSLIAISADTKSLGDPEDWAEAVIAAKHGDPNAVVMFALGPLSDASWDSFEDCADDKEGRICQLLEFFPHQLYFDHAIPDYGVAFDQAADLAAEACSEFIPR